MLGPQYIGVRITLTLANHTYNLFDLVKAIEANAPSVCRELQIQAASGNADVVLIGDSSLGTARIGYELARLESRTYRGVGQVVPLNTRFARSATAGQQLNIDLEV